LQYSAWREYIISEGNEEKLEFERYNENSLQNKYGIRMSLKPVKGKPSFIN
jgi:hypothetical protein